MAVVLSSIEAVKASIAGDLGIGSCLFLAKRSCCGDGFLALGASHLGLLGVGV